MPLKEYSITDVSQGPRGQTAVGRVDFRLLFPDGNPSGGNSSGGVGEEEQVVILRRISMSYLV